MSTVRTSVAVVVAMVILAVAAVLAIAGASSVPHSAARTSPQATAIHNGFGGAGYGCPYVTLGSVKTC